MKKANYIKLFLKDKMVAAVVPTSSFGVKKLCRAIDFRKNIIVVEYGPGSGVFTKFILNNMNAQSKIIAIESNPDFVSLLREIKDHRLLVFHNKVQNLNEILEKLNKPTIDYIISGIPFSYIKKDLKMRIIENTYESLARGGKFLVYQYSNHIKKYLNKYFQSINSTFEILNIPTLFIFEAIKNPEINN
jgi:phospholipid N-methyltransferase